MKEHFILTDGTCQRILVKQISIIKRSIENATDIRHEYETLILNQRFQEILMKRLKCTKSRQNRS